MDRRTFTKSLVGAVASYALFEMLYIRDAFGRPVRPITEHWVRALHEMSRDLKTGTITPAQWQEQIKTLFDRVSFEDLLAHIDFERLVQGFTYPDLGVHTKKVPLPHLGGLPERLAFNRKIFGMQKGRAIIPHGHKNMVSCHYVIQGAFQLKHYDKVDEDETHMIITPTVDIIAEVGSHSSISDEQNNVHWLKALTETAFTFDVLILDIGGGHWDVDNIDPADGEKISGNLIRARKLDVETALKKYGKEMHH